MTGHTMTAAVCAAVFWAACGSAPAAAMSGNDIHSIARRVQEEVNRRQANSPFSGFFLICAAGSGADVEAALAAGGDPREGDPEHGGILPLSAAAGNNPDPGAVRALLKAGAGIDEQGSVYGRTALHMAVLFNPRPEVIEALLEGAPDLEIPDREQETAVSYAIKGKNNGYTFDGRPNDEIILPLLKAAARLPVKSLPAEIRVRYYAFLFNEYLDAFASRYADSPYPSTDVIRAFHALGITLEDMTDKNTGRPILARCLAFGPGQTELLEWLLEAGADPNAADASGAAPLHFAAANLDSPAAEALLAAGADPNAANGSGETALHWLMGAADGGEAAAFGAVLRLLLDGGSEINPRSRDGSVPLHFFARRARIDDADEAEALLPLLRQYCEQGADREARDARGRTPLFGVTGTAGLPEYTLQLLRELGCEINAQDDRGMTPLILKASGYSDSRGGDDAEWLRKSSAALLAAGADPAVRDHSGRTAWDYLSPAAQEYILTHPRGVSFMVQ